MCHNTGNVSFNPHLKLNNVLCVPSFNLNLMSISKLTNDMKCYVTFYPDSCVMQDLATLRMIVSGKQFGGLCLFLHLESNLQLTKYLSPLICGIYV